MHLNYGHCLSKNLKKTFFGPIFCGTGSRVIVLNDARIDDQMYPFVFVLLSGKTQAVYTQLLTKLKTSMADLQLQLAPTTIFMDFETTAQNAARAVFPGINVNGCFFHYTQAIWRKTQHTGLQVTDRNNDDIRQLVRRATVLPLVPKKSSCSTTRTGGFNRRCLVQCTK